MIEFKRFSDPKSIASKGGFVLGDIVTANNEHFYLICGDDDGYVMINTETLRVDLRGRGLMKILSDGNFTVVGYIA